MNYELADGTVIEDDETANILRIMDRLNPLDDDLLLSFTEAETVAEFIEWQPKCFWCEDINSIVLSTGHDNYFERSRDEYLYQLMIKFNDGRRAWANNEIALAIGSDDERVKVASKYLKYVTSANKASNIKAAVNLFRKTRTIKSDELNQEPTVIGTPEGVVDLDKGCLLTDLSGYEDAAEMFFVTKKTRGQVECRFNTDLEYDERWDEFVLEIMCGDKERVDYLQRALGYSILGGNPEECMFIAYGPSTRNGKGTLLNTVSWVLGDYAGNMPKNFLTRKNGNNSRSSSEEDALGALNGKRFVTMSEPSKKLKLDEATVKELTGNDPITASRKYCPTVTFEPQMTMWLMCNNLPEVEDTTVFTSGRVNVIPFERHFKDDEQDPTLKSRFKTRNGMYTVLSWLMDGYLNWKKKGLKAPKSVRMATALYAQTGGDDFQRFIDTKCVFGVKAKVKTDDFYTAFETWCKTNDCANISKPKIRERLKELSIPSKRGAGGHYYFRGIGLKFDDSESETAVKNSSEGTFTKSEGTFTKNGQENDSNEENESKSGSNSKIKLDRRFTKVNVE